MLFEFKNLGIVESAAIEVKGLTVITGLNDTGKSFISKAIYSVIKTVNESNERATFETYEQLANHISQIFSNYRQMVPLTPQKNKEYSPNEITSQLLALLAGNRPKEEILSLIGDYADKIKNDIEKSSVLNTKGNAIENINRLFATIAGLLFEESDEQRKLMRFFDNVVIQRLFQGQINSVYSKEHPLEITIKEGETQIVNIVTKDNKVQSFELQSLLFTNDSTIIETPTIIQLVKFITTSLAFPTNIRKLFQQRTDLPYPFYDLVEKINTPGISSDVITELTNNIKRIIGGELSYNSEERGIVFAKNGGAVIKSFNIATGIKSFGLLQMLLNSGSISTKSVLIIDEPEVHLHPKWEIEYAKLIVALSRLGIPIIISTHSAYFIRALVNSVQELGTKEITKYYFGMRNEGSNTTRFSDVTGDLTPIWEELARPMQDLIIHK
jgi:hypothetical protein